MPIGYNTALVTNGLVFAVDFANRKSYSGSGSSCTELTAGATGTLYNTPTFSSSKNGYLSFNGTSQYILYGNDTRLDTQTPTVEVWARTNATSQNGFWFEKGAVNTQYSLFQEGGSIQWRLYIGGVMSTLSTTTATYLNTTNWFQVVGTYTSGSRILYINGAQVNSDAATGAIGTSASGMSIGSYNSGGYYYNGDIAYVKVYNRVLSAQEVKQNFAAVRGRFGI